MKYFSKKRFTMRQVVGLLTFVFLGITVIAYAAVTIPNSFSNGQTISSSQMNANFTAVANQMPGVKQSLGSVWVAIPTTANSNISSISVTPPGDGYVIVTATGTVEYVYTSGSGGRFICLDLHNTNNYTGGCTPDVGSDTAVRLSVPDLFPTTGGMGFDQPYSIVKVFSVTGGTTTSFYLNGYASGTPTAALLHPTMTAVFVPNLLP